MVCALSSTSAPKSFHFLSDPFPIRPVTAIASLSSSSLDCHYCSLAKADGFVLNAEGSVLFVAQRRWH